MACPGHAMNEEWVLYTFIVFRAVKQKRNSIV
jgi:hypothetical protein